MCVSQTLGCCVMPKKKKKIGNTLLSDINMRMASLFCERLPIANKFNKLKSLLNTNNKKKNQQGISLKDLQNTEKSLCTRYKAKD